jgi:hypothetical protein
MSDPMNDPAVIAALIGASATIATGFLAVLGAVVIGVLQLKLGRVQARIQINQTRLTHAQTKIQDRQVRLADASNRIGLFDRRMTTYQTTKEFLLDFRYQEDSVMVRKLDQRFNDRLIESRFLFDQSIYDYLTEIWEQKIKLKKYMAVMDSDAPTFRKLTAEGEINGLFAWAEDRLKTMHSVFAQFLDIAPPATEDETKLLNVDR